MALVQAVSLGLMPEDDNKLLANDPLAMNEWVDDGKGNMVPSNKQNPVDRHPDPFMRFVETGSYD